MRITSKSSGLLRLLILSLLLLGPNTPNIGAQHPVATVKTLTQVELTFDLAEIPANYWATANWEVSYKWYIGNLGEFYQWTSMGEDPAKVEKFSILLSKGSFAKDNLSNPTQRQTKIIIPVTPEITQYLNLLPEKKSVVWLDAIVHIQDPNNKLDVVKTLNPVWLSRFNGVSQVTIKLRENRKIAWFTSDDPAAVGGKIDSQKGKSPGLVVPQK